MAGAMKAGTTRLGSVVSVVAASGWLAGCSSVSYVMDAYSGVPVQEVATAHDTFRVFDKSGEGRMMVTSSLGASVGNGLAGGLLLNPTVTQPPKPVFQEAAERFLSQAGRKCKIVDGYLLVNPQWEFKYDCAASEA